MRLGQNPAKFVKDVAQPARVTVAVLTYIPFLSGFYAESLEVLKISLASLRDGAMDVQFDLLVFDNGSCQDARDYLVAEQAAGRIQYLFLSEKNLGKGGAWNIIFGSAPGEIVAYADSDVLYSNGWLSRSLQVLETFPNVGMVTSRPFRTPDEFSSATINWAQTTPDAHYERGQFLSWEDYSSFVMSLGVSEDQTHEWYEGGYDMRVHWNGVSAHIGASHWQFVAYKHVLLPFLPFDMSRPMGQVRQLDQRINEAGLLRLMTSDPLTQNMSNQAPKDWTRRTIPSDKRFGKLHKRFWNQRIVKGVLMRLYDRIFYIYYR